MKVPKEKFNEVVQTWEKLPQSMKKCPNCGRVLSGSVQDAWENNKEEAWAYASCPKCGDIALWKVAKRWKSGGDAGASQEDTRR